MSGVWGWFGGQGSQKKKDSPKNAILGLRSQLEMLQKRERHLQNQMDEQDAIARKNVSTNKNGMYVQRLGVGGLFTLYITNPLP
jgi:charged multivesicular body protein 4